MPDPTRPPGSQEPDPNFFFNATVPTQFREYGEGLQKQIQRLQKQIDDLKAVQMTIEVNLEGKGGGTWFINVKGGEATAAKEAASPPLVTLTQSIEHWRASVLGTMGPPMSLFGGGGPLRAGMAGSAFTVSQSKVDKLRQMKGTLLVRIVGQEPGREWRMLTKFGTGPAAPQPNTTVEMSEADSVQILQGKLNPQTAFMSGKVKILGDMGLAMQIAMLMMAG